MDNSNIYAYCDTCGWHGHSSELRADYDTINEYCPKCGSTDTWWCDEPPEDEDE